jgi:putative flippase GtrA
VTAPATLAAAPPTAGRVRALLGETWRYFAVSIAALAVDYGLLVGLTEVVHWNYLTSSAVSYSSGAVLQYALSVTLVFRHRRMSDRRLEFIAFFAIGLMGLALTQVVLKIAVEGLGLNYVLGKAAATGLSFVVNFVARRALLFAAVKSPRAS